MAEVLTIEQINDRFDAEWVLVEDPEVNESLEVLRGRVVWHSKDRDEVYQRMLELRPLNAATLYTGSLPENTAIIL